MHREVVLRVRRHVLASLQKRGELQFEGAVADHAIEHAFFRDQIGLVLHHEGTRLPQLDRVANLRVPPVAHRQVVDRALEGLDDRLRGARLRKVPKRVGRLEIDGVSEERIPHEALHLAVERVVAADQAQLLHDRLREVAYRAPGVGDRRAVQHGRVGHVAGRDVLEDDLPLLLLAEPPVFDGPEDECGLVEFAQILVLPVYPRREQRNFDVQRVDVLARVLAVDLHDERRLRLRSFAHGTALQLHALSLDGLDELHEGVRAHDADVLLRIARIHLAQPASERLFREDVALGRVGPQADDGGHVAHVPPLLEHEDGDDRLERTGFGVDLVGLPPQEFQLLLGLPGGGLGDFAVVLCVDGEHRSGEVRISRLQIFRHLVAVAGVVRHHEEDRLFPHLPMLLARLSPLDHTQVQVVGVLLGELGALLLRELRPAGAVGKDGVLHHVLADRLHQRIVGDGLHEDRPVVVLRRRGDVHLQAQGAAFLQQTVVDVLDRLEPGELRVVDVVRFVVDHHQLVDVAHDHAQVHLRVGGLSRRARSEEVVHGVLVVGGGHDLLSGVHPVDVGQEDVSRRPRDAHLVLLVQGKLKVVPPVAPAVAVLRQHGILEEDAQPLEVVINPVEDDDVGRDHQEVARQLGVGLVQLVEEAPRQRETHHLGLAAARRHLDHVAPPALVEHPRRHQAAAVEAHQVELVLRADDVVEVDQRFQRLALGEVVAEVPQNRVLAGEEVRLVEPPSQKASAGPARAAVAAVAELLHLAAELRHKRRHQLVHRGVAQRLVGGEPAHLGFEHVEGGGGKIWMQRHYLSPPAVMLRMVIVSLPKMSTTFTAILRRPGGTSCATLFSSSERSFLVRKLCHSFSKM